MTNNTFETALKNKDNLRIINNLKKRYSKWINDEEELNSRIMYALWRALEKFDDKKGCKFTSYLYRGLKIEFNNFITGHRKHRKKYKSIDKIEIPYHIKEDEFHDIISILPKDLALILEYRIIYNMTLTEIAKIIKCSHETVRRNITKALLILKNNNKQN